MNRVVRSGLLFVGFSAVGFFLQVLPVVDREFVAPFILGITALSGGLIDLFGGSVLVIRDVIQAPTIGFAVRVDNGCSGLEAVILCVSAVLAFPTTWKMRLIGVLVCASAILSLNIVRIISLFYIGQYSKFWFDWAHLYAWDILIMLDGVIALMLWIRFALARAPQHA